MDSRFSSGSTTASPGTEAGRTLPIDPTFDPHTPPGHWIEVFASPVAEDCRERALVLRAQGIPFSRQNSGRLHQLLVPLPSVEHALAELSSYESENRDWPPPRELPVRMRGAGLGTAGFALVISTLWLLTEVQALDLPWRRAGAASAEAIRAGELWRAMTALSLHTGPVHLFSNLLFGSFFGMLLAWSHGSGLAWFGILISGTLGNVANAWIQDPMHVSVGASTAVFGAVGLLAGSEWRRRHLMRERRLRVAAPIVMGLLLLALHGVPEDPTGIDVMAHVTGLLFGLLLGPLMPYAVARGAAKPGAQRWLGAASIALLTLAWLCALV